MTNGVQSASRESAERKQSLYYLTKLLSQQLNAISKEKKVYEVKQLVSEKGCRALLCRVDNRYCLVSLDAAAEVDKDALVASANMILGKEEIRLEDIIPNIDKQTSRELIAAYDEIVVRSQEEPCDKQTCNT